jgi:uracil-DNA glycosylase
MNTPIDWEELDAIADEQKLDKAFEGLIHPYPYVGGEGDNPEAFIIGEAPGAQEAAQGRPFVGPAGRIMRQLMGFARLHTEDWQDDERKEYGVANCWLTNVVKFRPPGNRNPTDAEIIAARHYIRREWRAIGFPQLIIPVGSIALQAITGKKQSILRAAGKLHLAKSKEGTQLFVWPMVHPSFGVRNPPVRPLLELDWERLAGWLDSQYRQGRA